MTSRNESSTKWNRLFTNVELVVAVRKLIMQGDKPCDIKIAKGISHTVYPELTLKTK